MDLDILCQSVEQLSVIFAAAAAVAAAVTAVA